MARRLMPPVHPGEILDQEFLEPLGLTQYRLAKDISVPARRINEIVHGERSISADSALRLARYFGTMCWLSLSAVIRGCPDRGLFPRGSGGAGGRTWEA